MQFLTRADASKLTLIIDGWSKTYTGAKCIALLLSTTPTETKQAQTWLMEAPGWCQVGHLVGVCRAEWLWSGFNGHNLTAAIED